MQNAFKDKAVLSGVCQNNFCGVFNYLAANKDEVEIVESVQYNPIVASFKLGGVDFKGLKPNISNATLVATDILYGGFFIISFLTTDTDAIEKHLKNLTDLGWKQSIQ